MRAVPMTMVTVMLACSSSSSEATSSDATPTNDTPTTDTLGETSSSPGFSSKYPGDLGIDKDPAVVWAENFEEGAVDAVVARYDDHNNAPGMSLAADVPSKSGGKSAMKLVAGGANSATDVYKKLADHDELWVRWYVKYQAGGK